MTLKFHIWTYEGNGERWVHLDGTTGPNNSHEVHLHIDKDKICYVDKTISYCRDCKKLCIDCPVYNIRATIGFAQMLLKNELIITFGVISGG